MMQLQQLMLELFDANPEQIKAAVREHGSLNVRLAMLGVASSKRESSSLYYSYPPGVFISYKWDGEPMKQYVTALASHLRGRGYRAFLDVDELDADADNYTSVPQYITSVQECVYYLLLLTRKTAEYISARHGKTSWIFDEYQHAIRLTNAGRLVMIPLLIEDEGTTDFFTRERVVDLTQSKYNYERLDELLPQNPTSLTAAEQSVLRGCLDDFDSTFLESKFAEALAILLNYTQFSETFDHQFRLMLYAIYTANQELTASVFSRLNESVGEMVVRHLYSGYCQQHSIPNRLVK